MLEQLLLVAFLQLSEPAIAPPAETAAPAEPELVCTMEPITGTRARKQKICKPKGGFDPNSDAAKQILRDVQQRGGNWQPKPAG